MQLIHFIITTNTVFISYAWESAAFRDQVKALRDYLLANGVAVVSDFDHAIKPPDVGWPAWMQHSIEDAAVVLVVCSASYRARFEKRAPPGSGKGVAWEGAVITQDLYNAAQRNNKFYPIFPDPLNFDFCPKALEPWSNGHAFPSKQADVLALVFKCMGVPVVPAPASVPGAHESNPFNPMSPAIGPRFFGRGDLLRDLQRALEQNLSVSLVGDWRIGKSSLLQAWKTKAAGLGRTVRWLSGEFPEGTSCTWFIQAITGETIAQDEADCAANALAKWVGQFPGLPPVILLDEAEPVLEKLPHRFFERLRGLIGARQLCMVLASRQPLGLVYEATGRTSPFDNVLELRRVGLLEQAAAEQMIALGAGLFDDAQRALMRKWAGRHPYFLALCGRHIWDACCKGMPQEQMMDELNDEAAGRVRDLWRSLSQKERAELNQILDGEMVKSSSLRVRGLTQSGVHGDTLFGEVLASWLKSTR